MSMMQSSQPEFDKAQQVKGMPGMRKTMVSFHQSIDADDRVGHSTSITFTGGAQRKERNVATRNMIGMANSSTDTFKGTKKSSKSMINKDNVSQKGLQGQAKTIQPTNRRMTKTFDGSGALNNLTPRHSIINTQMFSTSKISLLANKLDKLKMYNYEARNIQKEQRKQYQKEIMEKYEPIFE